MSKREIYYEFILPYYDSLSTSSNENYIPNSDSLYQHGEVRALCNQCPERVITYDQLTSVNPISMYADGTNGWTSSKKNAIKSYIDAWLHEPKYFDLRNYWDANPRQEGGMSLIVSHSPEVNGEDAHGWSKFRINGKTVYCSIIVSSGDFFYNWNLPGEILKKSGLRNEIVSSRFHTNWYIKDSSESAEYVNAGGIPRAVNSEKIVFTKKEFKDTLNYAVYGAPAYCYYFKDNNGNIYYDTPISFKDVNGTTRIIHDKSTIINNNGIYTTTVNGSQVILSRVKYNASLYKSEIVVVDSSGTVITVTRIGTTDYYKDSNNNQYHKSVINTNYYANDLNIAIPPGVSGGLKIDAIYVHAPEDYSDVREDLKKDFIDLEVTRRILYYCDDHQGTCLKYPNNVHKTRSTSLLGVPTVVSGTGSSTALSFEPPSEYQLNNKPPLQIPYNLLRYSLNDRAPFSDCETVLVMWVADSGDDPDLISDTDNNVVKKLHDLDWQQYAIPISVRCHFKDTTECSRNRFLVLYPHTINSSNNDIYRFHFRRCESYNSSYFRDVLYLRDLIEYSNDYVVAYWYSTYFGIAFDNQRYLIRNCSDLFRELYVRKQYRDRYDYYLNGDKLPALSNNQNNQIYYIRVDNPEDNKVYDVYYNTNLLSCFVKHGSTSDVFSPGAVLTEELYKDKWNLDNVNDWYIPSSKFFALFSKKSTASDTRIVEVSGKVKLDSSLKDFLCSATNTTHKSWEDLFICSFGISSHNILLDDSFLQESVDGHLIPLGLLDNYIFINNVRYGSTSNGKVIVGFKNVLDYSGEDKYHFHYSDGIYKCTTNSSAESDLTYTAYVMDYTP